MNVGARVAALFDLDVVSMERVSGGDVADALQVTLADGGVVFAKTHDDPPPFFFETEADGLAWLSSAGAVAVPDVLAVEPGLLVLSWIDEGRPTSQTDSDFGRRLARLHRSGAPTFGRLDRRTTGSRALPNEPCASWAEFYASNRLLPLARLAADTAALSLGSVDRIEVLAVRLGEIEGGDEPAARLHGDLWAGNRLVGAAGESWLVDPAAHGGHREFDLAMMQLFGGYGAECFEAYDDEYPLAQHRQSRVPLHQLAPLIVHAVKFGGPYPAAVDRALDACDGL